MRLIPMAQLLSVFLIAAALATSTSAIGAQDPLKAYPSNYKLALDNLQIRVLRCHYGPHEKVGVHNHSDYPTIYVYLSDSGEVRFSHVEEHAFVMTRPPVKKGAFRVSPGRRERHTVENLSDLNSDYLRIELKEILLHSTLHPFRGEAPTRLQPGVKEELSEPQLSIHRIVCSAGSPCSIGASKAPTLLVAFSPLKVVTSGSAQAEKQMQSGEIEWLQDGKSLSISASGVEPAHLLQIELHRPSR
jgi:hypothetical protein